MFDADAAQNSPGAPLHVFFSTAGQGPTQDYAWQSEDGQTAPEMLDEISEKYIDTREMSWVVKRTEAGDLLLIVRQLTSRITDPGLRRHKNAFAIQMPQGDEGWMRAIMIEMLRNPEAFAKRIDELVSIDSENFLYGWKFRFEDFRSLLVALRDQAQIGYAKSSDGHCSYRFSSSDSRQLLIEKLTAICLPMEEWIAICNPIVTDAVLEMPIWALITDTTAIPRQETGSKRGTGSQSASFPDVSSDEIALVVIGTAALIVLWLLLRRK